MYKRLRLECTWFAFLPVVLLARRICGGGSGRRGHWKAVMGLLYGAVGACGGVWTSFCWKWRTMQLRMGSVPLRKISLESIEEGLGRKWKGGDHLGGGGLL